MIIILAGLFSKPAFFFIFDLTTNIISMKKAFFTLLIALFSCSVITAQTVSVPAKESFKGNWFISAGAGALVYVGESDDKASFSDRIAPNYEFSIGKWVDPLFAFRLQLSGFSAKGATGSGAPYVDLNNRFDNGYYAETFDVTYLHLDLLFNFSAWAGWAREKRFVEFMPMVGVGWAHSSKSGVDFNNDNAAVTGGLLTKFRISKSVDFNIELKGTLVNENFDGVTGRRNGEGMAAVTAGISVKL